MNFSTLEAVDLSIGLELDLDEFEQVLEIFPFVDEMNGEIQFWHTRTRRKAH